MNKQNAKLVQAYNNTKYVADISGREVVLMPGQGNLILDELLADKEHVSAAIITAWNPRSEACDRYENDAANKRLLNDLEEIEGLLIFPSFGEALDGNWSAEDSFLVFSINEEAALKLAVKYEQNAFVFYNVESEAKIVLTRIIKNIV